MPGGVTFAEVLDQELASFETRGPAATPAPPLPPTYRAPHPLLFAKPHTAFRATAYGPLVSSDSVPGTLGVVPTPRPVRPSPLPPPPPRVLSTAQRRALDSMVALGATLDANFTARELRSAFRTLARQYHPDRHPSSSNAEKARLAHVFAELNDDHHRLMTVFIEPAAARF
jgi:hypothetical protein